MDFATIARNAAAKYNHLNSKEYTESEKRRKAEAEMIEKAERDFEQLKKRILDAASLGATKLQVTDDIRPLIYDQTMEHLTEQGFKLEFGEKYVEEIRWDEPR